MYRRALVASALACALALAGCAGPGGTGGSATTSPTPSVSPSHESPTPPDSSAPSASPSAPASESSAPTTAPTTPPAPPPPPAPAPEPAPSSSLPASLTGVDWERIPTSSAVVALTFDGGASDAAVASILTTLAAKNVHSTFFVTGDFARRYPHQVAAIAAAGHRLGNHSDTHAHYPALLNVQITDDLARAEASIVDAAGQGARPLFRFPHWQGTHVRWSIEPGDHGTRVIFVHSGFSDDQSEYDFGSISLTWARVVARLKEVVESGGDPNPALS